MVVSRKVAIAALKRRGIVPKECVFNEYGYGHDPRYEMADDGSDSFQSWFEPLTGPGNPANFSCHHDGVGFGQLPLRDHCSSMIEVRRRDGIEWRLARVLFSQPYRPEHVMRDTIPEVRDRLKLRMTIADGLEWHSAGTILCVYTPLVPLSFRDFCRTFRYWIITNVEPAEHPRAFEWRDADILAGVPPPHPIFFDLTFCCDVRSVRLGLGARAAPDAWEELQVQEHISYDTFAQIWGKYRASLCKASDLMAVLFVAKLRHRAALRAFAPGGRAFARLVKEWAEL